VNKQKSNLNTIKCGVPQGSTLDPMLFLIFINDLPVITNCKSYLIADDTTLLLSHNNTAQLELKLNLELEKIQNLMNANKLTIKYTKTEFTLFSKISRLASQINLSCGGIPIEQVESIKYLGVVIDSRLNWELHIAHMGKKVACGSAALYKL